MDNQLKQVILSNKSKGVQYFQTHLKLIRELIASGETPGAIYQALTSSDFPPPISRSQFYRHVKKQKLTADNRVAPSMANSVTSSESPSVSANPRHEVLRNLKQKTNSIHDSGIDPDNLI